MVDEWMNEWMNDWINDWFVEMLNWLIDWILDWMNKRMNAQMNKCMSEWMNEPKTGLYVCFSGPVSDGSCGSGDAHAATSSPGLSWALDAGSAGADHAMPRRSHSRVPQTGTHTQGSTGTENERTGGKRGVQGESQH